MQSSKLNDRIYLSSRNHKHLSKTKTKPEGSPCGSLLSFRLWQVGFLRRNHPCQNLNFQAVRGWRSFAETVSSPFSISTAQDDRSERTYIDFTKRSGGECYVLYLATNNLNRIRFERRIFRNNAPKLLVISAYYCVISAFLTKNMLSQNLQT